MSLCKALKERENIAIILSLSHIFYIALLFISVETKNEISFHPNKHMNNRYTVTVMMIVKVVAMSWQ